MSENSPRDADYAKRTAPWNKPDALDRPEAPIYRDGVPRLRLEPCRALMGYDEIRSALHEMRRGDVHG